MATRYEPIELVDNHHGIHIPQIFAESINTPHYKKRWHLTKDLEDEFNDVLEGADNEYYWDSWDTLMSRLWFKNDKGKKFYLGYGEGAGDLFAFPEGYEYDY